LANTVTLVSGGICATPRVSVGLPTVPRNGFQGIGSIAATTPFNLSFLHCPARYGRIGYSFGPTAQVLDAMRGVVALAASCRVAGVGLHRARGDGTPVAFGTVYPLADYDPRRMGSYVVPLQPSLYQVSPTETSGTVRSAVTFTLDYK